MGFTNADGSSLVGGLTGSGVGQALKLDGSGNLLIAGGSSSLGSLSTPSVTQDQLRGWINSGQGFNGTTGKQNAGGAITTAFSLFNPAASGKNLLIYSLRLFYVGATCIDQAQLTTTDPALGSAATVTNNRPGGGSSQASVTYSNTNTTVGGTAFDVIAAPGGNQIELFPNGAQMLLPSGTANGLAVYLAIPSANVWAVTARWIEC